MTDKINKIKYYNELDDEEKKLIRENIKDEREKLFEGINESETILSPTLDFEEVITFAYSENVSVKWVIKRKKDAPEEKNLQKESDVEISKKYLEENEGLWTMKSEMKL